MSERQARYIVRIGNVIHGIFPKPAGRLRILRPDPVPYEVFPAGGTIQLELNLTGGSAYIQPSPTDPSAHGGGVNCN